MLFKYHVIKAYFCTDGRKGRGVWREAKSAQAILEQPLIGEGGIFAHPPPPPKNSNFCFIAMGMFCCVDRRILKKYEENQNGRISNSIDLKFLSFRNQYFFHLN